MTAPLALAAEQVRHLRILAQGLPASRRAPLVATLAATGYVRTLGGTDVYVAARARVPACSRADLDAAVAEGALQVIPAVRGCIYLVPRADVAVCLRVADLLRKTRDEREAAKAGIRAGEIDAVAAAALQVLRRGPLTTDAVRRALPEGTVRSLGERGKKVGIGSPLPLALRQLEFAGAIERTLDGGRLDTERYLWRVPARSPFAVAPPPTDPTALHAHLLAGFLGAAGVTTIAAFAAWSGLSQRDAKAALAAVPHVPVTAPGLADGAFARADAEALLRRGSDAEAAVALLPFEDNLTALAGGTRWLVDERHHDLVVPYWGGGKTERLGDVVHLSFRPVLADGRLLGFWEYDPDGKTVFTRCFAAPSAAAGKAIAAQAEALGALLRDELGHGHSFSLDSDDELRKRIAQLQALGGGKAVAAAAPRAKTPRRPAAASRKPARKAADAEANKATKRGKRR